MDRGREHERPRSAFPWALALLSAGLGLFLRRRAGMGGFLPTHWDEGLAWNGARYFASLLGSETAGGVGAHYSPTHSPPLFSATLGILERLTGGGPALGAALNGGLSVLGLVLLARIAYELSGRRAAVFTVAVGAVSRVSIHYGRSLLTEPLYVALLAAGLLASLAYVRRPSVGRALVAGACAAALQLTKYNGVLLVVPLGALLLVRFAFGGSGDDPDAPAPARRATLLHGVLLGTVPALAIAMNLAAISRFADIDYFFQHYAGYVGAGSPPRDVLSVMTLVVPAGLLIAAALGVFGLARSRSRAGRVFLIALGVWAAFPFVYTFYLRLLAPLHALLLVAAGIGWAGILAAPAGERPTRLRQGLALALLALVLFGEWRRVPLGRGPRFDAYERAAERIDREPPSLPLIAVTQQNVWPPLEVEREVVFADLPSDRAAALLEDHAGGEVLVAMDAHGFSKFGPGRAGPLHAYLSEANLIERIEAHPGLEVLENALRAGELREHFDALERGQTSPAEPLLQLSLFRVQSAELVDWLEGS